MTLFIRKLTKREEKSPTAKMRSWGIIPELEGYDVVYRPYGEQGAGFYYAPNTYACNKKEVPQ